jgi:predicted dehydrogenase
MYRCWCHLFSAHEGKPDLGQLTKRDGKKLSLDTLKRMHLTALSEEDQEYLYPHGVTNPMAIEIWDFIEAVRGNRERVEVDGWDGLTAVAACHALYESALTGKAIRVDDILTGKQGAYQVPIDEHWKL